MDKSKPRIRTSLETRIFLGFVGVMAAFAALSIYAVVNTQTLGFALNRIHIAYLPLTEALNRADSHVRGLKRDVRRIVEVSNPRIKTLLIRDMMPQLKNDKAIADALAEIRPVFLRLERMSLPTEEQRFVEKLNRRIETVLDADREYREKAVALFSAYEEYEQQYGSIVEKLEDIKKATKPEKQEAQGEETPPEKEAEQAPAERDAPQAIKEYTELLALADRQSRKINELNRDLGGAERKLEREMRHLTLQARGRIARSVSRAQEQGDRMVLYLALLTVLATAVGLIITLLARKTLKPLYTLVEGAKAIARGEYTKPIAPLFERSADEVGMLAREFDGMAKALRQRETQLTGEQEKVEEANREIQQANLQLIALKRYHENIVLSIRLGVLVADADLTVSSMNPAAEKLWEKPAGEAVGKSITLLGGDHPLLTSHRHLTSVMAGGDTVHLEAVPLKIDGDPKLVDISVVPFVNAEGTADGIILIADDVSEKAEMRTRLLHTERLAAVGRLAAQIAHEVRNPLNSIGLNAELLEEELESLDGANRSSAGEMLASIQQEISRLEEVTGEYLRFARLPQPQLGTEDINQLLSNLLNFVEGEMRSAGVETKIELGENIPLIQADRNQLRQAFLNLIRNSNESMKENGGRLTVRTHSANGNVTVEISDTGSGMPQKTLDHVFDPFFSTKEGGTGLGLTLTQEIINEHGGEITVDSAPGEGSTFRITLPIE